MLHSEVLTIESGAFVPPEDVESAYLELVPTLPADLEAVSNHIDWYYIRGNQSEMPTAVVKLEGPLHCFV